MGTYMTYFVSCNLSFISFIGFLYHLLVTYKILEEIARIMKLTGVLTLKEPLQQQTSLNEGDLPQPDPTSLNS